MLKFLATTENIRRDKIRRTEIRISYESRAVLFLTESNHEWKESKFEWTRVKGRQPKSPNGPAQKTYFSSQRSFLKLELVNLKLLESNLIP